MNEREALLRAVCDNPDDDTPRLVFADWLQEHGDEARAEFIRVQIALDRASLQPSKEAQLRLREVKLLLRTREWKNEAPGSEQVRFVRGFIHHAHFRDCADFLNAYDRVPLRSVAISGSVDLLAVMKAFGPRRIEEIDLRNASLQNADVEVFAGTEWPHLPDRLILPWFPADWKLRERIRTQFGTWVQWAPVF